MKDLPIDWKCLGRVERAVGLDSNDAEKRSWLDSSFRAAGLDVFPTATA